ncbi:hypothetical protein LTR95_008842 [Oleoguttula sp. CCFEE 5521]
MSGSEYLVPHFQRAWDRPEIIQAPVEHRVPSTHTLPSLDYVTAGVTTLKSLASLEDPWYLHQQQQRDNSSCSHQESHWTGGHHPIHGLSYDHWQSPRPLHHPVDSAYSSDCSSERHMSTFGSPLLHTLSYSPTPNYGDHILGATGLCSFEPDHGYAGGQYIKPDEVEIYANAQCEEAAHSHGQWFLDYTHQPEDGFTPMQPPVDHQSAHTSMMSAENAAPMPLPPLRSPVVHRRRRENRRDPVYRVQPATTRRRSIVSRAPSFSMNRSNVPTPRPFPCPLAPYGCTSSFTAKNEWKRHVYKQHLRTAMWRCKLCPHDAAKGHNEFNRKDLFVQHVRRMHTPKTSTKATTSNKKRSPIKSIKHEPTDIDLDLLADQCCLPLRGLPEETCCLFCDRVFEGPDSFEDRLEHVGTHFEGVKRGANVMVAVEDWRRDQGMEDWLCVTGVGSRRAGHVRLVEAGR